MIRTAYPRFKANLNSEELTLLYHPDENELDFVKTHSRGSISSLTLLVLLKSHERLSYFPSLDLIPDSIKNYLAKQLGMDSSGDLTDHAKRSRFRYFRLIRRYRGIVPYSQGGQEIASTAIEKAAYTMSDPADLINVALETLIKQKRELPAFSTLNRLVGKIRQQVHQILYKQIAEPLTDEQRQALEELLLVEQSEKMSPFARLKQTPGRATLSQMRLWSNRLEELEGILDTQFFVQEIAFTKIRQFAAEAQVMELHELKQIKDFPKRYSLLLCLLHKAQRQTRDELVKMLLKRMYHIRNSSRNQLKELQDQHRDIEEALMNTLSRVVDQSMRETNDKYLGRKIRQLFSDQGGAEIIQEQYQQVSAYHSNNYLPLLWRNYRIHRSALFKLLALLDIDSATQDDTLIEALNFIQSHQKLRRDYFPQEDVSLDFASQRWQVLIKTKDQGQICLKRRELEVCVFSYLVDGLRSGDLFVSGSEEFGDYRTQLLDLETCQTRSSEYCKTMGWGENAQSFVAKLQEKLREAAQRVDKAFPQNTELSIDAQGKPHLKRLGAKSQSKEIESFKSLVRDRMPQRHLLDILKAVQDWSNYIRHFGPVSGSDPKLSDPISRYLFTVFGYGCNLGANQTASHTLELISPRILRRINQQHINSAKLDAATREIINEYARFELPLMWGKAQVAVADGKYIPLIENNLLGERHIRYGGYGGIAYHHISDTYIALFSHFIACGVWEAVYILDGLIKNTSKLQADTVHADTHRQSEPVFGLAYLLGIQLMPRIRGWGKLDFCRPDKSSTYKHIDTLFSDPVNWKLIQTHWKDLMQVVLSIQAGKVLPSMLLQKLGVYARKNKLYRAFRELGRVIRSIYLLEYISSKDLRMEVRQATTKVESFHAFRDWISFGGHTIVSGDPVEQEKRIKYVNLVANAVMLHNVVDLTELLNQMTREGLGISPEMFNALSPYMRGHIKRFGQYFLDVEKQSRPMGEQKILAVK